ncbi:MAG: hypothetical protein M1812_006539 [Candelaria pacifica]|nr:MAG: hypothetical protein M1812_006539 [Candelaria pacifica]
MFARSIRASSSSLARVAGQHARRTFVTPTIIRQADLVQDLYLRELKAYKPTPVKASDADGHVQKFTAPKAPLSPEEGNIANDLKAYEDQTVEIEGQAISGEDAAKNDDWFEEEAEEESSAAH